MAKPQKARAAIVRRLNSERVRGRGRETENMISVFSSQLVHLGDTGLYDSDASTSRPR